MVMTEEIREEIIEADAAQPPSPRRKRTLGIAAGAAILVAGIVAAVAVAQGGGDSSQPEITAAPASPSSDAVRALARREWRRASGIARRRFPDRGQGARSDDPVAGRGRAQPRRTRVRARRHTRRRISDHQRADPAPRTQDEVVRDLVSRGLVPAATLDDGSQIICRRRIHDEQDEVVRELVERGLVPAAPCSTTGSQSVSALHRPGRGAAMDLRRAGPKPQVRS